MAHDKLKQITPTRAVTVRQEEAGKVKVLYNRGHALEASLASRTVQCVREALAQPLNISPQAVTLVGDQEVEGTHILMYVVIYAGLVSEKVGVEAPPLNSRFPTGTPMRYTAIRLAASTRVRAWGARPPQLLRSTSWPKDGQTFASPFSRRSRKLDASGNGWDSSSMKSGKTRRNARAG